MSKKCVFTLVLFILLVIGCGGGSDSGGGGGDIDEDLPDENSTVDVSGEWKGTMTTNNFGETQTVMVFKQNGSDISGEIDFGKSHSDNISGSVDNSVVTVSIMFLTTEHEDVEFALEGNVDGNTFRGTFTIYVDGELSEQGCEFYFERDGDAPPDPNPDPDPDPNPDPDPDPNPDPNPRPDDITMSAIWEGNMISDLLGNRKATLTLEQNGSKITGKMTLDENVFSDELTGSINDSTANIIVRGFSIAATNQDLEFDLEGKVDGNTYRGTLTIRVDNEIEEDDGEFTFTKDEDTPPNPEPQPPNPGQKEYEIEALSCFNLSTGEVRAGLTSCDDMDMEFWSGAMVDIYSSEDIYCVQDGTYQNLESIPDDYTNCRWHFYIEGADGLENTGVLVRDLSLQHHYKMRIIENDLPTITFEYEQID